ncbi:MAG: heavy metal translocating P-type ATPase, partial [bacterium]
VIYGMDCISCAKSIKNTLLRRMEKYVDFLDIDFQSQKMFVKLRNEVDPQAIIDQIRELGYDAKLEEQSILEKEDEKGKIFNLILTILFASIVFIISMFFHHSLHLNDTLKFIVLILSTFVQFVGGFKFYKNAFYGLKNKILNMDLLIILSTTTAYLYSLYGYFKGFEHLYFETSAVIIAVVLLGKHIEEKYKKRGQISVLNLLIYKPQKVNILKNEEIVTLDVEEIKEGDVIELLKGQSVPVDGIIVEGEGLFDLNLIFGENEPTKLKKGQEVFAGAFLLEGNVKIQATCSYKSSFWKGIESSLYNLNTKTSNYQKFIDKVSGNFVIIIVFLASISFIFWYLTGNKSFAFNALISTLIIACPCAIGLASPLAINKGMIQTSKKKIIVKDPYVFEKLSKAKNFVFDKTGTITNKNIVIKNLDLIYKDEKIYNFDKLWQELIILTVSKSRHPLSVALKNYLQNELKTSLFKASRKYSFTDFKEITSQGLISTFIINTNYNKNEIFEKITLDKITVIIGNKAFVKENLNNDFDLSEDFDSFALVKTNDKILVLIGIQYLEELNKGIEEILNMIKNEGKEVYILTGASKKSALKISEYLKIDPSKVIYLANALKKTEVIDNIKSKGLTVFIGDGLNDSLVMNTADVGISFEYGSDLTQNSAHIILKDISQLKDLIIISKEVFRKLKFNLFWVFGYNVLLVPVAMGIFAKWGITVNPIIAAIAMILSDFSLLFFNLTNILPAYEYKRNYSK